MPGGRLKRILRLVILGPLVVLAMLLALWAFAPPVSTLMAWRAVTGQPMVRDWVPLSAISPHLPRAVVNSEDALFCTHHGVDWAALGEVLDDEGGPRRGASTLTMQTAKNLFLWHGRSYIRKALELPLALVLDLVWSKRRILEVYLNIAEWGDGVFGAEAAAQRHFGKAAAALTPREAALLAAALPNPLLREAGKPSPGLRRRAARVLTRAAGNPDAAACALR